MTPTHPESNIIAFLKEKINLERKLAQFNCSPVLNPDRVAIGRILARRLPEIIEEFYSYLDRIPETRRIINGKNLLLLKEHQRHYWAMLFSTAIDDDFINRSIIVGFSHFRIKLPAHLYIAGYTFFQTKLIDMLLSTEDPEEVGGMIKEAVSIIHLDMSISLSAYFFLGLQGHLSKYR